MKNTSLLIAIMMYSVDSPSFMLMMHSNQKPHQDYGNGPVKFRCPIASTIPLLKLRDIAFYSPARQNRLIVTWMAKGRH